MKAQASTPDPLTDQEVAGWFAGRLPDKLFTGPPAITADRDEILVVGEVDEPEIPADVAEGGRAAARSARIARFRDETRDARIRVARDAEDAPQPPLADLQPRPLALSQVAQPLRESAWLRHHDPIVDELPDAASRHL